jgi:hypothetical protein
MSFSVLNSTFNVGLSRRKTVLFSLFFLIAVLISIMAQTPINWVLSHSSVKSAIEKNINPNQKLKITASQGTLWQGSLDLALVNIHPSQNKPNHSQPIQLGNITWNIQLINLLWANLSAQIDWRLGNSQLKGLSSINLLDSDSEKVLQLSDVTGSIDLKSVIHDANLSSKSLPPIISNISGYVLVNQLEASILLKQAWFSTLKGDLLINDLSIMNNEFTKMKIKADYIQEAMQLDLLSKNNAWELKGKANLKSNMRYSANFKLQVSANQKVPDWAFLMRKESATKYTSKIQGHLF